MVELKVEDLKKLRENKRNFNQMFDLVINISGLDLKKPENRIRDKLKLTHKVRDRKICFIVESLITKAKETKQKVFKVSELDFKKSEGKKLAGDYDFFVVEAPLMSKVAKILGKYIGPRNKSMIPLPPTAKNLPLVIQDLERTVSINLIKQPLIQIPIGTEKLKDEELIENFNTAYTHINENIESKGGIIKAVYLKLTMCEPIKLL